MFHATLAIILFSLLTVFSNGSASSQTDEGSFENPSSAARPLFRYWLPDPSVNVDVVASDIISAGEVGAGGVEFIPFYNYGGEEGGQPAGADWATYGFGTPEYRNMFISALKTHADNGLIMDFPLGPNQGQGVPAEWDDEGLQWDLVSSTSEVPSSGVFEGVIPGWKHGQLVALTSALVRSEQNRSQTIAQYSGSKNLTWTELLLSHDSLEEHTSKVESSTGHVKLTFPRAKEGEYYRVFAFYQRLSHHKNLNFEPTAQNRSIFSNGSFVVDHHSARGAQTIIKFWEDHFLTDEVLSLIRQAGNYAWEDSVEILSNITWTPSLPELFETKHGYSIQRFLPLLNFKQNTVFSQLDTLGAFECLLDSPSRGIGYVDDYHRALEHGYNNYVDALRTWVNQRLGLKYSIQPAYGLPQDMTAAIPYVDVPEYESLGFKNSLDGYRQFIGTAHLAQKKVISNELGAAVLDVFSYTIGELLATVHLAIIGGTNQIILHGQTFSGQWYETTWPGYTPFRYLFSEMYSPKQPAWNYGLSAVLDYIARLQFVQRQGIPRTDVAVFNRVSRTDMDFPDVYSHSDLREAGYSYSYISPAGFDLAQAYVRNGLLAPEGPAWKAIIVPGEQNLTVDDSKHLQNYAMDGLPIILASGRHRYRQTRAADAHNDAINDLLKAENVYSVLEGEVSTQLVKLNIQPRVMVDASGVAYSTWREDIEKNTRYAFIYNNQSQPIAGRAILASTGIPYTLDAWTGTKKRVLSYIPGTQETTIPINLNPGQTMVIALDLESKPPSCYFNSTPPEILGVTHVEPSSLSIHVPALDRAAEATLFDGRIVQLKPDNPPEKPFQLSEWELIAEHWERPSDINDAETIASKRNTTHSLGSPTSWLNIPELRNASGVGYYTGVFNWDALSSSTSRHGAYLHFSTIIHTLQVFVNGKAVEPFDHSGGMRDISRHLVSGQNTVSVVVPTTMWNYVSSIASEIQESGEAPLGLLLAQKSSQVHPKSDVGLVGNVTVVPYATVEVQC